MSSGYNGYLMLNKEIKRFEYFTDIKTFHLFFWLVSDANFIDGNCNGVLVKRGQKLTSYRSLVIETGLTEREVRTALEKLIKSNDIIKKTTNKNTLLTVVKYEYYTGSNESKDKPKTNQRQTNDKQTTTIEEFKNLKKEEFKKIERVNNSSLSKFDLLFSNSQNEVLKLKKKYEHKLKDFDFCIKKFNDWDFKNQTVTLITLEKWLQKELEYEKSILNNGKPKTEPLPPYYKKICT